MKGMAAYLALAIKDGRMDYKAVVTNQRFAQFKDDIDTILIAEGREDLIVD